LINDSQSSTVDSIQAVFPFKSCLLPLIDFSFHILILFESSVSNMQKGGDGMGGGNSIEIFSIQTPVDDCCKCTFRFSRVRMICCEVLIE
jgi:hypothetical protein